MVALEESRMVAGLSSQAEAAAPLNRMLWTIDCACTTTSAADDRALAAPPICGLRAAHMRCRSPAGSILRPASWAASLAMTVLAPVHAVEKASGGPPGLPGGRSAFALHDELGIDTLRLALS
jgi:hypothetical protein